MKGAGLVFGLLREVESQERGDIGGSAIFEDLALLFISAHSSSPDIVLGGNTWLDSVVSRLGRVDRARSLDFLGVRRPFRIRARR